MTELRELFALGIEASWGGRYYLRVGYGIIVAALLIVAAIVATLWL